MGKWDVSWRASFHAQDGLFLQYSTHGCICTVDKIDEGDLWGLSMVHYEDAYYAEVMEKVRAAVLGTQ